MWNVPQGPDHEDTDRQTARAHLRIWMLYMYNVFDRTGGGIKQMINILVRLFVLYQIKNLLYYAVAAEYIANPIMYHTQQ